MAKSKSRSWQDVIASWDEWTRSQSKAKAFINRKYADKLQFIKDAKVVVEDAPGENQNFRLFVNKQQWLKWKIVNEIEGIAGEFVTDEMGLEADSDVHTMFVDHWINGAFPILHRQLSLSHQYNFQHEGKYVHIHRKRDKKSNNRIAISVTWYEDEANQQEIAEFLHRLKWPFKSTDEIRHEDGRPKEANRIIPEAFVCYVLRRRCRLTEGGVGRIFGWKTKWNPDGKLTCRLVRKRLKLARQIIRNGGNIVTP